MGGRTDSPGGGNLGEQIKCVVALVPATVSASAAGAIIDRLGFNSAVFHVKCGAGSAFTSLVSKVQHDTDSAGGTMADLAAAVSGSEEWGAVTVTISAASTAAELNVDLRRANRYIQIYNTLTGTSIVCGITCVLGANVLGGPV